MNKGVVKPISEEAFKRYGQYFNMKDGKHIKNEKISMYMTERTDLIRPLKFGITVCDNANRFQVDSMERHLSSEEVQFAGEKPIILSVASSDPWGNPCTEDVESFLLKPGDLVILNRGIWHDACHSVDGKTTYYFLSYTNGEPSETAWLPVTPEPVWIEI